MKPTIRRSLYALLTVFSLVFAAFIFVNGKDKSTFPELKDRTGVLAQDPEWPTVKANYEKLRKELETKPEDKKIILQFAKTFMQEGRVTGNFSYYNKAALDMVDLVLKKDPAHLEAICLKAMTFLSQHRFAEAKELAENARQLNPHYSFVYGLLCDTNVELGNYAEAVASADKMVSTRPDIRSYSRVSYLREKKSTVICPVRLKPSNWPYLRVIPVQKTKVGHVWCWRTCMKIPMHSIRPKSSTKSHLASALIILLP